MREKLRQLAKQKFNYVIGGYANMFEDMDIDTMPILFEVMFDEIVDEVCKDIRFLGTDRIKEIIKEVGE